MGRLKTFYCSIFVLCSILNAQSLEGKAAPTFWLQDINQEEYFFSKRDTNKPMYINFFATWCSPCLKELQDISALEETYSEIIDIVIIDVSTSASPDDGSKKKPVTSSSIQDLVKKFDIKSKVLIDNYAVVAKKFNIKRLPTNIFISKDNVVVKDIRGMINKSSFKTNIDSLRF